MSNRVGARQLRELLQEEGNLMRLLGDLFPGARVTRPVFTPLNPTRDDRTPGSFVIWTTGAAKGGFREYSPRSGGEASGDVLDLIAYVHNQRGSRTFAMRWASDFLGIRQMDPDTLRQSKERARKAAREALRSESKSEQDKRQAANRLFNRAQHEIVGTLAEAYLASRGIVYRALSNPEFDLRFSPDLEWWRGAQWEVVDGRRKKIAPGPKFPAMVAAMRNAAGDITAVHCTFLRHDGSDKADVEKPKLMYGSVRGSLIRLTCGPSNLSWAEAAENGLLDVHGCGEGIETMLTVALACPEVRASAAGSFDNIANFPIDHASVDCLLWCRDDDGTPEADEKFSKCQAQLQATGKTVAPMSPHSGAGDFNDLLQI